MLPNGGANADALGVSSNGFIVGDADSSAFGRQAVEWNSSGAITALPLPANTFQSQAFAVNSSGVAVGDAVLSTDGEAHPEMWANGKVTELAPGTITGFNAVANAINNNGVIVGGSGNGDGFVYQNGTATDLNALIAPTAGLTLGAATGINAKGQIAAPPPSTARTSATSSPPPASGRDRRTGPRADQPVRPRRVGPKVLLRRDIRPWQPVSGGARLTGEGRGR